MNTHTNLPPTLTISEAADILRIARSTAYEWARTGELRTVRLGGRLLVPTSWLITALGLDAHIDLEAR